MEKRINSTADRFSAWVRQIKASSIARKLSPHFSIVLMLLVLFAEGGIAAFVMRDLARTYATVEKMYNGSVQGLLRFGDMQYEAQETRRSTLYALSTSDGNLQVEYADQSRNADGGVALAIAQYVAQARTARELELSRRLANDWNSYLKVRDAVLGLILEGSPKEAVRLDLSTGVRDFDQVRRDLEEIKQTYDEQASQQLATVAALSQGSIKRLAAALAFGLVFGTVAIWAIQRNEVRNTMGFAKLQMDFVASVSHELRTPLTAILTAGENIRDGLAFGPEQIFEQGSVITNQATQLVDLIDQVLQFSAASKATLPHPAQELRITDVIEHALRATQLLLDGKAFVVETSIVGDLPRVLGDLTVLSQCLQNLIMNAAKYSNGNRWIGISAHMNEEETEILIDVRDRGIGIQSSELSRIFEPFYRSPQVAKGRIHGTGLGLSIAKRSAERFGGRLTVASEVGVGSIFTVHLPVAPAGQNTSLALTASTKSQD